MLFNNSAQHGGKKVKRIGVSLLGLLFCSCLFANTLPASTAMSTCTGKDVCSINAEALTNQATTVAPQTIHIQLTAKQPATEIRMPANATTGYAWQLKAYDSTLLEIKRVDYIVSSQLIGAGGQEVWRITAKPGVFSKPVTTQVTLIYARSWEKNQAPADSKTIVVAIR